MISPPGTCALTTRPRPAMAAVLFKKGLLILVLALMLSLITNFVAVFLVVDSQVPTHFPRTELLFCRCSSG